LNRMVGDRLATGESAEEIVDSFVKREQKSSEKGKIPRGFQASSPEPEKPVAKPEEIKFQIPAEAEQKLAQYMKQYQVSAHIQDTAAKKKDRDFKNKGKEDLIKAFEAQGKHTGPLTGGEKGDSRIKHEVDKGKPPTDLEVLQNPAFAANPTAFQSVILELSKPERTHLRYELIREAKDEAKSKKIREKIEEKRGIRDKYREFKLDLHPEDAIDKPPDAVRLSTQTNAEAVLGEILNSPKMGVRMGIMQGCFVSVLRVQSNSAMSVFTVFFTVIKPEIEQKPGLTEEKKQLRESVRRKLIHSKGFISSELVHRMGLKFAPELRFIPYVLGAPAKQVVEPTVLEEIEGNSELIWQLAEMEDQKLMTPRLPGKYVARRYKEMKAKPKAKKDS